MEKLQKLYRYNCPNLPIVRKCCFCVPIIKGVTIFGYVNLVLNCIALPVLVTVFLHHVTGGQLVRVSHVDLDPLLHLLVSIVFCIIDVALTLLLLIGIQRKKILLLKVYLYLGVVFQLVTLILDLMYLDYRDYIENLVFFFFLGFNVYLLFLVYCAIRTLKAISEVQYTAYLEQHKQNA